MSVVAKNESGVGAHSGIGDQSRGIARASKDAKDKDAKDVVTGIRVIKVGGAQVDAPERLPRLANYVREAIEAGTQVVVVHGGGHEIAAYHRELGVPFESKSGLRTTSERSMEIVTMVLCGLVNTRLVAHFIENGHRAIGLSGVDLGMLEAEPIHAERLGRVGGAPRVNGVALKSLLSAGLMPVVAPVSLSSDGGLLNVNADIAAQAIAVAIGAECLEFVTDVEGLRGEHGVERRIPLASLRRLLGSDTVSGGMIPKVQAALAAVGGGVGTVRMGSYESLRMGTATEVYALA